MPFDDRVVARELLEAASVIALMIAGAVAMIVSLVGTRFLITFFRNRGKGQPILGPEDRGPDHQHKAGTPTMGGLAIVAVGRSSATWSLTSAAASYFSNQAHRS